MQATLQQCVDSSLARGALNGGNTRVPLGRDFRVGGQARDIDEILRLDDDLFVERSQAFTGDDFFIDKDVCSIVLEMPNSALGLKRVGLWARTLDGAGGVWVQADRGALPAQAVFLVGAERDAYLAGEPADDARFVSVFAHALEHAGGYTPEEARRVAGTLLPEILSYDRRVARPFRAMAGRSPTMPPTPFWQSSQTGR